MARYLFEFSLTPQALASFVKNPQDRKQANKAVAEAVGGTLVEYYFAVGTNVVYNILEIPDPVRVEALTMAVLAGGAVNSVKCTEILTAAEAVEAMQMAGGIGYRSPTTQSG